MKIPIPDDYTGEWHCIQIQWPDSPKFDTLLRGFLTTMMRGRYWDERTGSIIDAQAIGWEIFDRNIPFRVCMTSDDCPECSDCSDDQNSPCGGVVIEGESDMGQVVTNIEVINGQLRVYFGPCCYVDLSLAGIIADSDNPGDDPLVPPSTGTPPTYSGCAKASAIVNAIKLVLDQTFEEIAAITPFWWILSRIENAVGFNLNNKWLAALVVDWSVYGTVVTPEEVFGIIDMQKSICQMQNVFTDDSAGVPDDSTYEQVKASIHTQNFLYDGLIMTAVAALGRENMDMIAKMAASDTTADCGCPDQGWVPSGETDPDENGWYLSANFASEFTACDPGELSWSVASALHTLGQDAYGTLLRIESIPDNGQIKRMDKAADASTCLGPDGDVSAWSATSENMQNMNQDIPIISDLTNDIQTVLAAQLGYDGHIDGGTGGINGVIIASPEGLAGQTVGCSIHYYRTGYTFGTTFKVTEFRFVHNVNSPSHTP